MTHSQHIASHVYRYFTHANPTDQQRDHLSENIETMSNAMIKTVSNKYMVIDDRLLHPPERGPDHIMVIYTSCHAFQFMRYLHNYRREVLDDYLIVVFYNHLLINARPHFDIQLLQNILGQASVVIHNPFTEKFGDLSMHSLMLHYDARVTTGISFVPPSMACFWPVCEFFGEEPVARYLYGGLNVDEIIDLYRRGRFDCMFAERYSRQMTRLVTNRELECDVKISGFIGRHLLTHKMFFTSNHPTFHVVGHIMDECLKMIGYEPKGEEFNLLGLPTNGGEMRNHNPETYYEWDHFKFTYDQRYTTDWGGHELFYTEAIRRIANRITDTDTALRIMNDPPEEPL